VLFLALQTSTFTSANIFEPLGVDNSWNLDDFKDSLKIEVSLGVRLAWDMEKKNPSSHPSS